MAKLVLRKETLQEAYNSLQQIEHNFKNEKVSDKKRPFKNTNYTIKELKKKMRRLKNHNVFRKYVLVVAGDDVKSPQGAKERQMKFVMTN